MKIPVVRKRLIIEGFNCKQRSIQDVYEFLECLSIMLDMRILVPPVVCKVPVAVPTPNIDTNDYGISGHIIWIESGCQIHTWPKYEFVALDMFSCKDFSKDRAIEYFNFFFNPKTVDILVPEKQSECVFRK